MYCFFVMLFVNFRCIICQVTSTIKTYEKRFYLSHTKSDPSRYFKKPSIAFDIRQSWLQVILCEAALDRLISKPLLFKGHVSVLFYVWDV